MSGVYIADSTTLTFRIVNLDITGFDEGFILQLCLEKSQVLPLQRRLCYTVEKNDFRAKLMNNAILVPHDDKLR